MGSTEDFYYAENAGYETDTKELMGHMENILL